MRLTRRYLTLVDKLEYQYHKEGWFLEAVGTYCDAVTCFDLALAHKLIAEEIK